MFPPVPTEIHSYVDENGKPSKQFFDWLKRFQQESVALESLVNTIVNHLTVAVPFSSLPAASTVPGDRRIINDAGPPTTFDGAASGGGGGTPPVIPVYSDGTIWRYG